MRSKSRRGWPNCTHHVILPPWWKSCAPMQGERSKEVLCIYIYVSLHGRYGIEQRSGQADLGSCIKGRAGSCSAELFWRLIVSTSIIQLIIVLLLTWHRADLPGAEPTYRVQSLPIRQLTGSGCRISVIVGWQPVKFSDAKLALEAARRQLITGC